MYFNKNCLQKKKVFIICHFPGSKRRKDTDMQLLTYLQNLSRWIHGIRVTLVTPRRRGRCLAGRVGRLSTYILLYLQG